MRSDIISWLSACGAREVVLTGHSLGGAVAQVAALELAAAWRIGAVVCFGAPLVGWQAFADIYNAATVLGRSETLGELTTTYVYKSDLVRFLLLPNLRYRLLLLPATTRSRSWPCTA